MNKKRWTQERWIKHYKRKDRYRFIIELIQTFIRGIIYTISGIITIGIILAVVGGIMTLYSQLALYGSQLLILLLFVLVSALVGHLTR